MSRLNRLTVDQLVIISLRAFWAIEHAMTSSGDGLEYGWDMATAGVLYPRLMRRWRALKGEAIKRGIQRVKVSDSAFAAASANRSHMPRVALRAA